MLKFYWQDFASSHVFDAACELLCIADVNGEAH